MWSSISMCLKQTLVSSQIFTPSRLTALVVVSLLIIIATMVRMTSLTVWKWIGLRPMVVVGVPPLFTLCLALALVLAIIGDAGQLTALVAQPSTCALTMEATANSPSPETDKSSAGIHSIHLPAELTGTS
jgi:hypothetical protein